MADPKAIFDSVAFELEKGKKLVIPCSSMSEADSLRVNLQRQKRKLRDMDPRLADSITVSRSTDTSRKTYWVIIHKQDPLPMFIQNQDGSLEEIDPYERFDAGKAGLPTTKGNLFPDPDTITPISAEKEEHERLREKMREDGMTEDEIEEYFKDLC
jgi:hypothetical protein